MVQNDITLLDLVLANYDSKETRSLPAEVRQEKACQLLELADRYIRDQSHRPKSHEVAYALRVAGELSVGNEEILSRIVLVAQSYNERVEKDFDRGATVDELKMSGWLYPLLPAHSNGVGV